MTSPTTIDTRTVRDIVEYSPDQVNEVWCRKIFRQILQSLELQYAMQMPHRAITPDTVVFHENGEPLLLPSPPPDPDGPPPKAHALRDDLTALASVVHYAITRELIPEGPLKGRGLAGYSDSLVTAVDRCMARDPAERPDSVETLRDILGIVVLGPAVPVRAGVPPAAELERLEARTAPPAPAPAPAPAAPAAVPPPRVLAQPCSPVPAAAQPAPAAVSFMREPAPSRLGAGLTRWQRWAIAAGGGAMLLAIALVGFSELRDAAPFDRVVLTLPQQGDGAAGPAPTAEGAQHAGETTTAAGPDTQPVTAAPAPVPAPPPAPAVAHAAVPAPAAAAPAPTDAQAASGQAVYRLQIQPWGVVYVDGVDRGVSPPVKRLELAPGKHQVRITNPNFRERVLDVDTAAGDGRIAIDFTNEAP